MTMQFSGNMCLTLYYHMNGTTMGTLNVYVNGVKVFSASGNKGNNWLKLELTVTLSGMYEVIIEGIRGSSYTGDMAIDDFKLVAGPCSS
ncbi:hypothetical protein OS493_003451, partial [Desmophyllum pertusum]